MSSSTLNPQFGRHDVTYAHSQALTFLTACAIAGAIAGAAVAATRS